MVWLIDKKVIYHFINLGFERVTVPIRVKFEVEVKEGAFVLDSLSTDILYNRKALEKSYPKLKIASLEQSIQKTVDEEIQTYLKECGLLKASEKMEKKKGGMMEKITIDEFNRLDLRVGEILKAERVEGTEKLLKLEVDIGMEKRQMIAGIADVYPPETMVGKKIIVVANLQPATIRGIESQAMLLAADLNRKPIIPFFKQDVPAGTTVR